jgi:hypothetical protein
VKLTATNDTVCANANTQSIINVATTEINPIGLKAYPNPVGAALTIETPIELKGLIFNEFGQLMQQVELKSGQNYISIEALPQGTYCLKYEGGSIRFLKLK